MQALGNFFFEALAFLLVLGVVVLVHESGHFVCARLVGVRVEVFSVGFGQALWSKTVKGTEYCIAMIPLGGYVRMAGEGGREGRLGHPDELESKRAWEQLLIFFGGPAFNLILAVFLLAAGYMLGVEEPDFLQKSVEVALVEDNSPGGEAGILPGDLITSLDGREAKDWQAFQTMVLLRAGETVAVEALRDGRTLHLAMAIEARGPNAAGWSGLHPCYRVAFRQVAAEGAAAQAGLHAGDAIMDIDGAPICHDSALVASLQAAKGNSQSFRIQRGAEELLVSIAATWNENREAWMLGVGPSLEPRGTVMVQRGLVGAVELSVAQNIEWVGMLGETLARLVSGRMSMRALSGPGEIAAVASDAAQAGATPLLQLMALISLNLGLLNLLPIPILDGGRMAIVGLEAVRGRELEMDTKEWILRAGLVMIVTLMAVVLFFDVVKRLEG